MRCMCLVVDGIIVDVVDVYVVIVVGVGNVEVVVL